MSSAVEDAAAAEKSGDYRAFLEANSRFHNAWRALIPNRRMSRLLDQYVGHVRFLRVLTLGDAAARKAALTGMRNIHAAFKKKDPDAAAAAMHKHLEAAKHFLITAIEQIDKEKEAEQSASVR
jgi:DNA-binding GntR family transcriptional regulator